jgi:hypothetical protein
VQVAIHARHKRLEDVVSRFAAELGLAADSPSALLYELNRRSRDAPPIVAVLDALDEAGSGTAADTGGRGEPRRIARDLLRPMSEIPGVRLLIGTRRELISSLGTGFEMLDLDATAYADDEDVAGYVAAVLLAADEPDVKTPYRGKDELAKQIGRAVAQRASGVYLVARMASRGLRSATEPVDRSARSPSGSWTAPTSRSPRAATEPPASGTWRCAANWANPFCYIAAPSAAWRSAPSRAGRSASPAEPTIALTCGISPAVRRSARH